MVKLFEHQEAALRKLHNGSILWGGTGSGKSITGLAYYYIRECDSMRKPKPLYIITTARKRDTGEWEGELARFSLRSPPVVIDSWNNIKKYADVKACFFLFDEQRVVGYGKWSKNFIKITSKNRWILLSATPGDCWMDYLAVFIANGFVRSKTEFERLFVTYNRFNSHFPQITGYRNENELYKWRDDILVGMNYEKHTVPHHEFIKSAYDRPLYNSVVRNRINPYTGEPVEEISGLCQLLRKIVNSDPDRGERLKLLMQKHRRAIIFYNYDYELEILRKIAKETVWPCAEWNGHRHEPLPTGGAWMYLVQYTAGAEGWNCIETDTVIFYSQSYSYKAMVQAAGRIDRLNTGYHDLYYYYFTSLSPIDAVMNRALSEKKDFNESAYARKIGFVTQRDRLRRNERR